MEKEYAVVTGASSGIGVAFAKLLAKKGYHLILVARRTAMLETLKQEIQQDNQMSDIHIITLDLSANDSSDKLLDYTQKNKLNITVFINNAGFGTSGDFLNTPIEKTLEMLQLNMVTLTKLTYLFGNEMKKNNSGYILQVSSVGAFQPTPGFAAYAASKAYVMSFGEALDYELKGSNVSVTTLYPGATKTEFFEVADLKVNPLVSKTLKSPEEVAAIALDAMFKRKRSVVPGFLNWITSVLAAISPRKIATWSAANVMK